MRIVILLIAALVAAPATAQQSNPAVPDSAITLARGASQLMQLPNALTRIAVADSSVANVVVVSPREILINGVGIGTTTMIVWDTTEGVRTHPIEVTVDAAAVQRQFSMLFPTEGIRVTAMGNLVVLSGTVSGGPVARQMVEIARATGGTVVENFQCIRPSTSC